MKKFAIAIKWRAPYFFQNSHWKLEVAPPSSLSPEDIFAENNEAVVDKLRAKGEVGVAASMEKDWPRRVVGYRTLLLQSSDLQARNNASPARNGVGTAGGDTTEEDRRGSGIVMATASTSLGNDASNKGNDNILLIIGAAGAALSLVTLIAILCYAKKAYDENDSNDSKKKSSGDASSVVEFQPGKNNPRSPNATSFLKRKLGTGSADTSQRPSSQASVFSGPPPPPPTASKDDCRNHSDDDASRDDFLLACAALGHPAGDECSAANRTYGDDQSYAFTADGESLAPVEKRGSGSSPAEDAMIGAGGLSSFTNEKGVFRWNSDGTKMVYTPNLIEGANSGDHNGFVFDELSKKWVVKDQVIGEKNVSFMHSPTKVAGGGWPPSIPRSRSNESAGTGISGLSGFTYEDIALEKRVRSTGTEVTGDSGTNASFGMHGYGGLNSANIPPSPSTPKNQGVEVPLDVKPGITSSRSFDSEFVPNTNVEQFMIGGCDDSTALSGFSGFTDFSNNNVFGNGSNPSSGPMSKKKLLPPSMPSPPPVTPEQVPSGCSQESCMVSTASSIKDPGRIVPKKRADARPNRMKISEDLPFDEDIPFDERVPQPEMQAATNVGGRSGPVRLNEKDAPEDDRDAHSESDQSEGSANSAQVLADLDTLSGFLIQRKRSSKKSSGRYK